MFSFGKEPLLKKAVLVRIVFVLTGIICISAVITVTSCTTDSGNGPDYYQLDNDLIGTWKNQYGAGEDDFDSYTITIARVDYAMSTFGGYGGTIEYVSKFTNDSGIIIIKYDNHEWDPSLITKYDGIYYKNSIKNVSVNITTATNDDYSSPATDTLDEAIATFTMGNSGDYTGMWPAYEWVP